MGTFLHPFPYLHAYKMMIFFLKLFRNFKIMIFLKIIPLIISITLLAGSPLKAMDRDVEAQEETYTIQISPLTEVSEFSEKSSSTYSLDLDQEELFEESLELGTRETDHHGLIDRSTESTGLTGLLENHYRAPVELLEKVTRYAATGATIIQTAAFLGMFIYHMAHREESAVTKITRDSLFLGSIASGLTSLARWSNWRYYQNHPPLNVLDYFQAYDPLHLKKLEIGELMSLTFIMMIPITVESYPLSQAYFITMTVFTTVLILLEGYKITNYFRQRPVTQS